MSSNTSVGYIEPRGGVKKIKPLRTDPPDAVATPEMYKTAVYARVNDVMRHI